MCVFVCVCDRSFFLWPPGLNCYRLARSFEAKEVQIIQSCLIRGVQKLMGTASLGSLKNFALIIMILKFIFDSSFQPIFVELVED